MTSNNGTGRLIDVGDVFFIDRRVGGEHKAKMVDAGLMLLLATPSQAISFDVENEEDAKALQGAFYNFYRSRFGNGTLKGKIVQSDTGGWLLYIGKGRKWGNVKADVLNDLRKE